ncbi:hypothetical protein AB0K88_24215 [Streptomyces werraensis]|uniref:hypothetical protein n=1 Tax=Streptomyces werraensis TaxID=68284 RepID=UPI003437A54A
MAHHTAIPPVDRSTNGHAAFVVQAAEATRGHTDQVAAGILTEAQRTPVLDESVGFYRTTPIESAARDIDDQYTADENAAVPFLSAEIVISDWKTAEPTQRSNGMFGPGDTVDGRFTEVWLSYGTTTGTVTPAKAREMAAEMRSFAARLDALCDVADEIAADDYEARG